MYNIKSVVTCLIPNRRNSKNRKYYIKILSSTDRRRLLRSQSHSAEEPPAAAAAAVAVLALQSHRMNYFELYFVLRRRLRKGCCSPQHRRRLRMDLDRCLRWRRRRDWLMPLRMGLAPVQNFVVVVYLAQKNKNY